MLESEKFAIAAHLHVTLRRTNGRVTDVEWMVKSPEYAREIIRVARTETHPDLLRLADKPVLTLQPATVSLPPPASRAAAGPAHSDFGPSSGFSPVAAETLATPPRKRYVGTLR